MLHGSLLPVGTMITAKTNAGLICGAGEVWEAGKFGLISIYKDDAETEEVEGVKEGEEITLYLGDYQVSKTIRWTTFGDVVNFSEVATGIAEFNALPTEFTLHQNYPNPFNPTTTIRYQLPKASMVTLKIYDVMGREVTTLVNEQKAAGYYEVQWNARNYSSGVYFYTIRTGEYSKTLKLLLVK
jgi:Secretion system C-terminal sorting domain